MSFMPQSVTGENQGSRRDVHLSFGQVLVLWVIVLGLFLLVFLFGLHAGRKQGFDVALEQYGEQGIRLPVIRPVQTAMTVQEGEDVTVPGMLAEEALADRPETREQELNALIAKDSPSAEPLIDFTTRAGLDVQGEREDSDGAVPPAEAVAGLGAKTVDEVLGTKPGSDMEIPDLQGARASLSSNIGLDHRKSREEERPKTPQDPAGTDGPLSELGRKHSPARLALGEMEVVKAPSIPTPSSTVSSLIPNPGNVKKTEEATTSVHSEPVTATVEPGWYVQVAAATNNEDASDLAGRLRKLNMNVNVQRALVQKKIYFRVLIGPCRDRQEALAVESQVKREHVHMGEPFVKRVH